MTVLEELEELEKDEMEIFDDYIEMVVTFGYITMFASVFVLGAPIVFVFLLIEARSDLFKLENTLRRPIPFKTYHIGSWSNTIELFCFFSVFSNIIVSCYASNQMDYLLPWLKNYRDDSTTAITTVFVLEHVLLLTVFALKLALDKDPEWINTFLARRNHKNERQILQKLKT
jgi:anoctamin-10